MRDCLARVVSTGEAQGHELHGIRHYAPETWYDCRLAPNLREGKVVSATIVAHDVTRHKRAAHVLHRQRDSLRRLIDEHSANLAQAKAALAQHAGGRDVTDRVLKRFRAIMDQAGEAIFVSDPQTGRVVDVNKTACRWLRRRRNEIVGKSAQELGLEFHIQPPEDGELQFTETRDTRRPLILGDGVHRRSDGSTFPVEVAVVGHTLGQRDYVLAVVRDAKRQKRAEKVLRETEANFQTLFEQSWDAIYLTTRTGQIIAGNRAALDLFAYPPDEFMGLDARALFPRAEDVRGFQREMSASGQVESLEVELRTKHGDSFRAQLSATRRPSVNGTVEGYQCIVRRLVPKTRPSGAHPRKGGDGAVLVVEADAAARAGFEAALAKAGIRVFTAQTPSDGLELFREHTAEIAVTVLSASPGGAGAALAPTLVEIVQMDPSARIVVMRPEDASADAPAISGPGVAAVLNGPVHPLALLQTLREIQLPDTESQTD